MTRQTIHFAPANSFPARAYNKLFSFLATDFDIGFLEMHAHDQRFPITNGWGFLAEELKTDLENRYSQPVIGVGHSLGGILHFLVAVEKPELYKAIILLDSPIISRLSGTFLKGFKRLGLMDKLSPSSVAIKRRREWDSKQAAIKHFERKFCSFDREMIQDYVEHGTIRGKSGQIELRFRPEVEAEIYRTIPDDFTRFRGKLRVPAVYIGGNDSREARLARLGFMRRNFSFKFYFLEGSHHFPFENPRLTAETIKNALQTLNFM